jgi:hypothetical protein
VLVDGGSCALTNNQDPVEIYVDKIYNEVHPADADPEVDITLVCAGATVTAGGIPQDDANQDSPAGVFGQATATTVDGRATFTVSDYLFYGSGCYATEAVPAGYVQDTADDSCGTEQEPGILVLPGGIQYDPPEEGPQGNMAPPPNCTISNDPTVATFSIEKDFSDDNPMAVDVTATCSDDGNGPGIVLNGAASSTASGSASEATPFAVEIKYADGSASCDGAEDNDLPGYTTEAGDGPAADCGAGDQTVAVDSTDVACEVFNDQDPIEIQAAKVYSNGGGAAVDFAVQCSNLDTGGTVLPPTAEASPGNPAIFTVNDVMWDGSTLCEVSEPVPPGGYYETGNTCTSGDLDMTPNSDDPRTCEITNTPTRATFKVTKIFADGNNVDDIEVSIDCNTGLILDQDKDLMDGDHVEFVVTSFTEGTLNCTITEDGQSGYSGEYNNISLQVINDESCAYTQVGGGDAYECEITNTPNPVDITVQKEWVFSNGQSTPDINTYMEIWVWCTAPLENLTCPAYLGPGDPDFPAEGPAGDVFYPYGAVCLGDVNLLGDGTIFNAQLNVTVVPQFPSTQCTAYEYVSDQAIEVDNGCGDFIVKVNQGKTCTITNTVFFEGIPTLSQYGMALLALLMLGVGFVSFRRFS